MPPAPPRNQANLFQNRDFRALTEADFCQISDFRIACAWRLASRAWRNHAKQAKLTPIMSRRTPVFVVVAVLSACLLPAQTAPKITTPKEALGFNLGDDYQVATYTQLETYRKKLAAESPRMKLESIGKTEEGRDQWMAVISAPENMKKLARYKEIAGINWRMPRVMKCVIY